MARPKVLVLTSSFPRWKDDLVYGGNGFVFRLCEEINTAFEPHVLAPRTRGALARESWHKVEIHRYRQNPFDVDLAYGNGMLPNLMRRKYLFFLLPFFFLSQFLAIRRIVREEKISLIHAHWVFPQGLLAAFFKRFVAPQVKLISTSHGTDILALNFGPMNTLKRFVLRTSDAVTAVSVPLAQKAMDLDKSVVPIVLPMGVDTNRFHPNKRSVELRAELGATEGPLIVFAGRCIEEKGLRHLVEAMPEVLMRFPKTVLTIVGEGALRSEMQARSVELGVEKSMRFVGIKDHEQMPRYLASADLFVLPSYSEGLGLVVLEAMSCGVPALVTNLPQFAEWNRQGGFPSLVEKASTSALIHVLVDLLSRPDHLKDHAQKARAFVIEGYDWSYVGRSYCRLLKSLESPS